jgi:hypothetical protein
MLIILHGERVRDALAKKLVVEISAVHHEIDHSDPHFWAGTETLTNRNTNARIRIDEGLFRTTRSSLSRPFKKSYLTVAVERR